jgi:UDP-N-acetylglucosamine 2-epimerase
MAESVLKNLSRVTDRLPCEEFGVMQGQYVLATVHRPENTGHPERLEAIISALEASPLPVLFPVHPRTRPLLSATGMRAAGSQILLMDPVGYLDMLALQRDAAAIVTDSGGIQEEACMLRTPCVTVRRNTERGITIDVGANRLVPADADAIEAALAEALTSDHDWLLPERWDIQVSHRVAAALLGGVPPLSGV